MGKRYSKRDFMMLAVKEHRECSEFPRVGVVVAKDGKLLATGRRGEIPETHAERVALEKLTPAERVGTTVYTTLEPCVEMHSEQPIESCADLIISSGVSEVVIGVLDPNATIYSNGYRRLLENSIGVSFFSQKLRAAVEEETFEYGPIDRIVGSGRRRVPIVGSGINITVHFSKTDSRTIPISWQTLQPRHDCVDLASSNGAVTIAAGARNFGDITDPRVFRFPSHVARMKKGMIAIVQPSNATFCVLIKLLNLFEKDILMQWEVRDLR